MGEQTSRTAWIVGTVIALLGAGGGIVALLNYINRPTQRMADLEVNIDRYGGDDYSNFSTPSAQACCNACLKDPKCMSFSFNVSASQCWLKSNVPLRVENRGFVSGVKIVN